MKVGGDWLQNETCQTVFALLKEAGFEAFVVGGAVRDAALGMAVKDVDFATNAVPEVVSTLAHDRGLKVIPTGIEHGTVTLVDGAASYEVTTYRKDVATDGRRAVVAFAQDAATDAGRRDFTMNALYARADGTVYDPLGGWDDLQARRIRFIGDAETRIREDGLRILRFFRFYAWFGAETGVDVDGLAACAALAEGLEQLSAERIGHEMRRLLDAPDPAPALASMAASGVLARVAPGALAASVAPLVALEGATPPDWMRRARVMGLVASWRWRFSKAEMRALQNLEAALDGDAPVAAQAYRFGARAARNAHLIRAASAGTTPCNSLETDIAHGLDQTFPIKAVDLFDVFSPGPELGAALSQLEAVWVGSDFALNKEDLIARASKL